MLHLIQDENNPKKCYCQVVQVVAKSPKQSHNEVIRKFMKESMINLIILNQELQSVRMRALRLSY